MRTHKQQRSPPDHSTDVGRPAIYQLRYYWEAEAVVQNQTHADALLRAKGIMIKYLSPVSRLVSSLRTLLRFIVTLFLALR
jgi:hypothetical protein